MSKGIKNVFGGGGIRPERAFGTPEALYEVFDVLLNGDCNVIDTAALYGPSEEILGQAKAPEKFTLDTKAQGGFGTGAKRETILSEAKRSKERLGSNVDIYYLHSPDKDVPFEETAEAINDVYKSGFFKRFGLSNFKATDVQKMYDVCESKGYVLPTVYQGNYSAVARRQDEELFPVLRKLNMSFYAYSPMAGGFLTKTKQDILDGKGRFDANTPMGKMYSTLYNKPSYLEALAQWEAIAKEEGCTRADLAYRWVKYNSPLKSENGDAIIIGASSLEQLKQTLDSINMGPLSDKAAKAIDQVWETIRHEAPLDNFNY